RSTTKSESSPLPHPALHRNSAALHGGDAGFHPAQSDWKNGASVTYPKHWSGSDDCTVRFWEVSTARCVKTVEVSGGVKSVAWCPNPAVCLVAVTHGETVVLINPGLGDRLICSATDQLISSYEEQEEAKEQAVQWAVAEGKGHDQGQRLILTHPKAVRQVSWHGKGDYLACVMPDDSSNLQVLIHQVSKRRSQNPFRKNKGMVQCVSFHPIRPYFFVATQRYVRIYNLINQELTKKLMTNCKWISSMAVHPGGEWTNTVTHQHSNTH
ncbi:ribosome biogenesis protein bop1, partial [Tachysurus ichikawai]